MSLIKGNTFLLGKCLKLYSIAQFASQIKLQSALVNAKNTSTDIWPPLKESVSNIPLELSYCKVIGSNKYFSLSVVYEHQVLKYDFKYIWLGILLGLTVTP